MIWNIFKYSIKNILRNKFLSFSSVLVLILLMFFINILLVLHNVGFKLIDSINDKMSISLYLNDSYDENDLEVINLMNWIKTLSKEIDVQYKTKEVLLEELRTQDPKLVWILEWENPLPNTILISNIWLDQYTSVNDLIKKRIEILDNSWDAQSTQSFVDYDEQYNRIINIISILNILKVWLYIIIWIFLLSIAVIVYSIIWNFIYYYRDEIYITKLVGWSNIFIYWPFVLQWIIYTFVSFLFAMTLFILLLKNISYIFSWDHSFDFIYNNLWMIMWIELIVFVLIWALSWYVSSKKYVKNHG